MMTSDTTSPFAVSMNAVLRQITLALLLITVAGCGTRGNRELVAVTIAPDRVDAQNSAGGQVQFAATGTYSQPPTTVQLTSHDIAWCIGTASGHCAGFIQTGANIDANGLARCNSGFTGTVTVLAGQPENQSSPLPDVGFQLLVFGTAQMTCP